MKKETKSVSRSILSKTRVNPHRMALASGKNHKALTSPRRAEGTTGGEEVPRELPRVTSATEAADAVPSLMSISGVVSEERSSLPLAGVLVRWTTAASGEKSGVKLLGTALTDNNGRFLIQIHENSRRGEDCCCEWLSKSGKSFLHLIDFDGRPVCPPMAVPADRRDIVLHPPSGGKAPGHREWKTLANFMATNRLLLVRDLAEQFARPYPDSPIRRWPLPARAWALRTMFATVSARSRGDGVNKDLSEQNHVVYEKALTEGRLGLATSHFMESHRWGEIMIPWLNRSDRGLYRDYLRGVWVATATKMYYDQQTQNDPNLAKIPSATVLESQLDERFLQDFYTLDDREYAAPTLLIPLLTSILTRNVSRGGFGLSAAQIPAQGNQSGDEYLRSLIALSKVAARELRNRFRVSFERKPNEKLTPIQLNIEALLGLLSDDYQSPEEPFNALPPASGDGKPLIFGYYVGRAPFHLQYEEWLERQSAFFPENVYDILKNVPVFNSWFRAAMAGQNIYTDGPDFPGPDRNYFEGKKGDRAMSGKWIERMFSISDTLFEAVGKISAQLYRGQDGALSKLDRATRLLDEAGQAYDEKNWRRDEFWWLYTTGAWNDKPIDGKGYSEVLVSLKDRARLRVSKPADLTGFERFFEPPYYPANSDRVFDVNQLREYAVARARTLYVYSVPYLRWVVIPYLRSHIFFTLGSFAEALRELKPLTGYLVGVAELEDTPGYDPSGLSFRPPVLYEKNSLPYTGIIGFGSDKRYANLPPSLSFPIAPFEQRFFKLAQGEAMLAWAEQLYRNDDPSSIRRARELYIGVIFLHGGDPGVAPSFPRPGQNAPLSSPQSPVWKLTENPAKVSQINRARLGLYQIEQGLNFYGYGDDLVPLLRYRPLKATADTLAASAKSAQTDFLAYTTRSEQAVIESWQTQSLIKKASASLGIARERQAIAQVGVDKAKEQVTAVEAQIAAKQKEIADKDSLFEQFKDFVGGIKDSLKGMVPLAKKVIDDDSAAKPVTGDQLLAILAKSTGGLDAAKEAAVSTLGPGMGLMAGFGAFVYTSYTSMESMAEAANQRAADLRSLQETALPAAKAQVRLKERDVTITEYESNIAEADLEFASRLFRFQQDRFLNSDFWNKMTLFANRLMRRYVDLGARMAWLAERALAFEHNQEIHLIKMNYLPTVLRGVTGADRLLADLAELEATRIQCVRLTTPIKHTFSLARDFPLQFGQLKKTGRCRVHTFEGQLRQRYPGTFGNRVRALTVAVQEPDGAPPRGIIRNSGISLVTNEDLSVSPLIRFPDALALSEFRLHNDLIVYGLPGETLMQFEGSGFESDWEIELPVNANPRGFDSISDVMLTFDMNVQYSEAAAAAQGAQGPTSARAIALSASNLDPVGLASLKANTGPIRITFDPAEVPLASQETKRQVTNLALICVGQTTSPYSASLMATKSGKKASFTFNDGLALSNDGPLLGNSTPLPLNALTGLDLNQPFALEIARTGVADELKRLFDVVLYVEYKATF